MTITFYSNGYLYYVMPVFLYSHLAAMEIASAY